MAILRKPTVVYPDKDTVSPLDASVDFTVEISGDVCQKYSLRIYEYSTGVLKKTYAATLTSPNYVYDGETLTIAVDMTDVSLGANTYYWDVDLYWDSAVSDAYVTSKSYICYAHSSPSISFSPVVPATITTQSYEFIGSYTQAQDIAVKWFQIVLYDSSEEELDDSNDINDNVLYSSNIKHTFSGLIDGNSYGVAISGETTNGVAFSTAISSFTMSYTAPTVTTTSPVATVDSTDSSVYVDWGNIVYLVGTATGTNSYVSDFNIAGNYGLSLGSGAIVDFDANITTSTFTVHSVFKPFSATFTGDMLKISNASGDYVSMGYDGTRFYINKNGTYSYGAPKTLTTNSWIIAIYSDGADLYQYNRDSGA